MVGMILSAEDTDSIDLLSADSFAEWDPLGQYRDSRAVVGAGIWVHMWVPPAGGFYLDVSCGGHFPSPPLSLSFYPRYCLRGEVFHLFSVTFTDVPFCSV